MFPLLCFMLKLLNVINSTLLTKSEFYGSYIMDLFAAGWNWKSYFPIENEREREREQERERERKGL